MQKKLLFPALVSLYEVIRTVFFVCAKPEQSASAMPLSWYASVPFLIFPLLFTFFLYNHDETARTLGRLYALSKLVSVISMTAYIFTALPTMTIVSLSTYKIGVYLMVLLFLLFDGILAIIKGTNFMGMPKNEE